ncbi:hypothetical protein HDV62DRAFT_384622 [Trichoderma sp. SZMC 28011]
MRRQPRPPSSGVSFPSPVTLGRRALSSRRNRTRSRTQQHVVNHSQIHTRTRNNNNNNSRLIAAAQQRPSASSSARFYSALSSLIESTAKESRDNIIMAAQSCPVPWARIKLWIEAQEKAEQQGNPLTKPQLQALSHLVSFVEGPEPDISAQDHVSLLAQHIQFHHKKDAPSHLPTYEDVGLEVPISGNFHWRWRTTCSLPSASHMIFPCEGHGVSQGQQPPLFATKKASKQYAAMHALAYLRAMRPPPAAIVAPAPASTSNRVSGGVSLKSATPPVSKSPKASDSSLAMPTGDAGGAPLAPPLPSAEITAQDKPTPAVEPQGASATADGEFYTGDMPSLLEQVAEGAKRLNFGVPKYEIVEDPNKPGSFNGKPIFVNGGRMPDDIGHVTGAMSKSVARQLIAEQLNEYFTAELKQRDYIFRSFTATPVETSTS